jgi:hypothetical protein
MTSSISDKICYYYDSTEPLLLRNRSRYPFTDPPPPLNVGPASLCRSIGNISERRSAKGSAKTHCEKSPYSVYQKIGDELLG